ncbi:MAG: methionine aminotransferase [Pseudomonadales bacterium]
MSPSPSPAFVLESKLPDVKTTIFTHMSELARETGALNLSQGFPDFDGPRYLLERVQFHLTHGQNQYAPMAGVMSLREAIADKVQDLYRCSVDPVREITVTAGATEALFCAISAVVRPGDEVILFDPAYDSYDPVVRLQGGRSRRIPLTPPHYGVDWDRVADALSPRTRLIVVNTPHNPTGSVWSVADLAALRELVRDREIYLLGDEVYEHIVFDGRKHLSLSSDPELFARSFVVSSFGKTYHVTGWKIGYCVAPAALTTEFRRVHQFVNFAANTPVQCGLADFLRAHPEHHRALGAFYERKRDTFCAALAGSRLSVLPSAGTYFQLIDYAAVANARDVDYAEQLTRTAGLATIPVSVFYGVDPGQRVLRLCFAKDDATLARAAAILSAL